jgi:hypothetical protein
MIRVGQFLNTIPITASLHLRSDKVQHVAKNPILPGNLFRDVDHAAKHNRFVFFLAGADFRVLAAQFLDDMLENSLTPQILIQLRDLFHHILHSLRFEAYSILTPDGRIRDLAFTVEAPLHLHINSFPCFDAIFKSTPIDEIALAILLIR